MEKYRTLLLQQLATAAAMQLPLPYALRSVASEVRAKELRSRILEIANLPLSTISLGILIGGFAYGIFGTMAQIITALQ